MNSYSYSYGMININITSFVQTCYISLLCLCIFLASNISAYFSIWAFNMKSTFAFNSLRFPHRFQNTFGLHPWQGHNFFLVARGVFNFIYKAERKYDNRLLYERTMALFEWNSQTYKEDLTFFPLNVGTVHSVQYIQLGRSSLSKGQKPGWNGPRAVPPQVV